MNHKQTFLDSLISNATKEAYSRDIAQFEGFIGKDILKVSIEDAVRYKNHLKSMELRALSINRKIASVRSFFEFLVKVEALSKNPFLSLKPESVNSYDATESVSSDDVCRILKQAESESLRDKTIIQLLFLLGLRRNEVLTLRVSSIRLSSEVSTISVLGKGNKIRTLPMPEFLANTLREYVHTRAPIDMRGPKNDWLFPGKNKDSHLHHNSLTKIVENVAKRAGVTKHVHPHMARVAAASNALSNGAPLEFVKEMGGWSSLEMVLRYDRRVRALKDSAIFKINYGGKK